jgi:hypothetical protein
VSSGEDGNASLFDIQMCDQLFYLGRKEMGAAKKKILYSKENNRYFVSGAGVGVLLHSFSSFFIWR